MNAASNYLLWSLISFASIFIVWAIGMAWAGANWHRHPKVSGLLLASLGGMTVGIVTTRLAISILVSGGGRPGFLLGVFMLLARVVNVAGWAGALAAVFSQRQPPRGVVRRGLQFSIRGLLWITLLAAVACGLGRLAAPLFVGTAGSWAMLIDDLPLTLCWIVGICLACSRWAWHPPVSRLTVLGIGAAFMDLLLRHAVWLTMLPGGASPNQWLLTFGFNFGASIVYASAWACIIAAALGWRGENPFAFRSDHLAGHNP